MALTKEQKYRIKYVDRILDPVHGFIDITQVEKEIIELPIFKRMQSIKQLSLTNWVFPGAEHTRYMHSLGVMYIVDLMAVNLKDLNDNLIYNDGQRQLLRLAGLLHDIGHYPLSHVTENVYIHEKELLPETPDLYSHNEKIKRDIDKLALGNSRTMDYMLDRYSIPMHHETMGTKVIEASKDIQGIIKKHCPFIDIRDIEDIIVGCVTRKPAISAMVQLMHSELDADGIDYVMRDATFSGTSYGGFELGLLLRNLVVTQYNSIDIVGIRPKGISIVDQYLMSKYFSYTQVIFNKHVAILGAMVEMFSKSLITLDSSTYPGADTLNIDIKNHQNNDKYLKFTDRAFWAQFDSLEYKSLKGYVPEHIAKIHDKLLHYQEFPLATNGEIIITSDKVKDVVAEIQGSDIYSRLLGKDENRLMLYHSKGFTSEISEEEFRLQLNKIGITSEEQFQKNNIARLQEGVTVIEKDKEPKLLADDMRSIMSCLHKTKTYILREYVIE